MIQVSPMPQSELQELYLEASDLLDRFGRILGESGNYGPKPIQSWFLLLPADQPSNHVLP